MDSGKLISPFRADTGKLVIRFLLLSMLAVCANASAEVVDSAENGFTLVHETTIAAPRDFVWRAAVYDIDQWWSSDHTISGDAGRLSIEPRPRGCFCETLGENAGVVHMAVTFVSPGVLLRLTGGLGPLGLLGVDGNMTWEFFDADDGTTVRFSYAVGGYHPGGLEEMAGPVDYVIGEALGRLQTYIEIGDPDTAGG